MSYSKNVEQLEINVTNTIRRAIIMRKDLITTLILALIIIGGVLYIDIGLSKYSLAYIVSGSMEPTYYKGDLIIMKKIRGNEVSIGDVIIFKSPHDPKTLILHRVVAVKFVDGKYYFLTKGDNPQTNPEIDAWGWVPEEDLVGKLIYRIPFLGVIAEILSMDYVRYTLLLMILILLILSLIEESEEERRIYIKADVFAKKYSIKTIAMIILVCSGSIVMLVSLNAATKFDVSVNGMNFQQLYYSHGYINYTILILTIKSYGHWISSIRKIEIAFGIYYKGDYILVGTTIWTVAYIFNGVKKVSIGMLVNSSAWDILVSNHYDKVTFKIKIYVYSIISGWIRREKLVTF